MIKTVVDCHAAL